MNKNKIKIQHNIPIAFIIFMIFLFGCNKNGNKPLENENIARSFIEAWSTHNVEKLLTLFAEDCLYEEVATGTKYYGKKEIAGYAKSTLSGVPDSEFEIVTVIASDNMSTVEWIWRGTNSVGWPDLGISATNKRLEVRGVSVMVIKDNLIQRNSDYWDWNTFMKSIGVELIK
jgi:steroid delta-isomerase-like uncharacterized protein